MWSRYVESCVKPKYAVHIQYLDLFRKRYVMRMPRAKWSGYRLKDSLLASLSQNLEPRLDWSGSLSDANSSCIYLPSYSVGKGGIVRGVSIKCTKGKMMTTERYDQGIQPLVPRYASHTYNRWPPNDIPDSLCTLSTQVRKVSFVY